MFEGNEITNIIHAGLVFIVYLFVVILLYYTISYPLDVLFNGLLASSVGTGAESQATGFYPAVIWGLNVAFALGFAYPITWFILWIFSREPSFSMFKR